MRPIVSAALTNDSSARLRLALLALLALLILFPALVTVPAAWWR